MPIENLFTDDLATVTPGELEKAIIELAQSGVEEKFRLDFKETWQPDKQCLDVVAFANSYGGLLVLGVSDDHKRFPGIPKPANSDLKTRISSTIAARISPVPRFEVHTCPVSGNPQHALVLIRITAQPKLHMYLKGDRPVYVRNEDSSVPARATELQALLDRVRTAAEDSGAENIVEPLSNEFSVTKALNRQDSFAKRQAPENRERSSTTLQVTAIPERRLGIEIDATVEQHFRQLIDASYPSIKARRDVDLGASIMEREDRRSSWFQYLHQDLDRDHEIAWAFDERGNVQCLFEVAGRLGDGPAEFWSIPDLFVSLTGSLKLIHELWNRLGFYGSADLAVKLSITKLVPFTTDGHYHSLFYGGNITIPEAAVRMGYGAYPIPAAAAKTHVTYDRRTSGRQECIISLGNRLLRDLRFSVDIGALRTALHP